MPSIDETDLSSLARRLLKEGPTKTLPTPRRVRILHAGTTVADTTRALYVWEHPAYPYFYLPIDAFCTPAVHFTVLEQVKSEDGAAVAEVRRLAVNGASTDRVLAFPNTGTQQHVLTGMVRVEFSAVDQWLEEDTPIMVHPKDPFKRVDLLASTRPVRVSVPHPRTGAPVELAHAPFAVHLHETSLPVRHYLPLTTLRASLLRPSARATRSKCPYKGEAEYYDVVLDDGSIMPDLVWFYRTPTVECAAIQGLCCFYSEKVDIEVDGEKQERPKTWFV